MIRIVYIYEAALTPSCNFSQELSKDQTTTYLKQKLVPTVWHWFSGGGGVKLCINFIIWIFGVLQSSQISSDWANTVYRVNRVNRGKNAHGVIMPA